MTVVKQYFLVSVHIYFFYYSHISLHLLLFNESSHDAKGLGKYT